jgi:hypothetical protein
MVVAAVAVAVAVVVYFKKLFWIFSEETREKTVVVVACTLADI